MNRFLLVYLSTGNCLLSLLASRELPVLFCTRLQLVSSLGLFSPPPAATSKFFSFSKMLMIMMMIVAGGFVSISNFFLSFDGNANHLYSPYCRRSWIHFSFQLSCWFCHSRSFFFFFLVSIHCPLWLCCCVHCCCCCTFWLSFCFCCCCCCLFFSRFCAALSHYCWWQWPVVVVVVVTVSFTD